jgi:hypothetical protein
VGISARRTRHRQRGSGLIILFTVFLLGFAWYAVSAIGKIHTLAPDRDAVTAAALQTAKQALLAYVAQQAANTTELYPGRLPCPEVRSQVGTANEGYAGPFAGPPAIACDAVGRLPWKTLGVSQIGDGYGEPLWYAVATGTWAWVNTNDALNLNPGTANSLTYNGAANAVVAVIVAPGAPLNTVGLAGAPANCIAVNQVGRTVAGGPTLYLECGNQLGSYTIAGQGAWGNDRTISITAAEVMDAISAAVAERIQRQVAPALNEWRTTTSGALWGRSYLPYASTFTNPLANDYCGNSPQNEGLLPVARSASSTCTQWTNGNVSNLLLLLLAPNCTSGATQMTCTFSGFSLVAGLFKARVTAQAPIGLAFRSPITLADISVTPAGSTVDNLTFTPDYANGRVTVSFDVSSNLLAWSLQNFQVRFANLPDAAVLSDARVSWFLQNNWHQYTYYGISTAAMINPPVGASCPAGGGAQCLTVTGLPSGNTADNKTLVLTYMGRPLPTQSQPNANPNQYLEAHTAATTTYAAKSVNRIDNNDRIAACPFVVQPSSGQVALCN